MVDQNIYRIAKNLPGDILVFAQSLFHFKA